MHVERDIHVDANLGAYLLLILWTWSWFPPPIPYLLASFIVQVLCFREELLEWAAQQDVANQAALAA